VEERTGDVEQLRADLERAERKIASLREVVADRKLRYERATAELERLRRSWPRRTADRARRAVGRQELRSFCLFIGYPRSGHSLLGALLDAHPDVAIAHGTNVLRLIAEGAGDRTELIRGLVGSAAADAERKGGRRATGYSYAVPGQWQGQVRVLRVVGAKAGEKATVRIGRDPRDLARLRRLVRAPIRLLHVTRNPFDMIARMALITKGGKPERTIAGATKFTARLARINARTIGEQRDDVLTVRHETFVRDPRSELRRIAGFLGVEPEPDWIEACAALVFPSPKLARDLAAWTPEERAAVEQLITEYDFFDGYSWTSDE
jgi:sulfotransferase family protein